MTLFQNAANKIFFMRLFRKRHLIAQLVHNTVSKGICVLTGTGLVTPYLKNYNVIYLVTFYFLSSNKVKNRLV